MSVPTPVDIITMAANAADPFKESLADVSWVLFAQNERSIQSGRFIFTKLIRFTRLCRVLELKQACYSATGSCN